MESERGHECEYYCKRESEHECEHKSVCEFDY